MGDIHRLCLEVGCLPFAHMLLATAQTHGHSNCKAGNYRVDVWPEGRGLWSFGKHMAASTILDLPQKGWDCRLQGKEIKARKNEVTFRNQVRTLLEEIFGA